MRSPELKPLSREDAAGMLAEGMHTAFRKGVDSQGAWEIWKAIRALPDGEWGEVYRWFIDSLASTGVQLCEVPDA